MKAVILAGGLGTRMSERTGERPKPMVEIGGRPILWHILKLYAAAGIDDFVICCGYRGEVIKRFFLDYAQWAPELTVDLRRSEVEVHRGPDEDWRVTLVDTGPDTMTGGRLRRVRDHVGDETFCLSYGDGVADIDLAALVEFHRSHDQLATLTAVRPPGRFGTVVLDPGQTRVEQFEEKREGDHLEERAWINGGFFVLEPEVIDHIDGDATVWEREPLERLARAGQLAAYRHEGFWQAMDTMRDRDLLEQLWERGDAPWRTWV